MAKRTKEERIEAIIAALPKTVDGETVGPGSLVWTDGYDYEWNVGVVYQWEVRQVYKSGACVLQRTVGSNPVSFQQTMCLNLYSTEEAARRAGPT